MENLYGLQFNLLNKEKQKIFFISGPTAIGKSSLAIKLAKKINGVIVNSDSMQVYSNLQILTARPSKEDHEKITHELYGYIEGAKRFNVATWCKDFIKILNKNKDTSFIVVGGTAMYVTSLINGLIDLPSIDEEYKKKSLNLINEMGIENFIDLIKNIDHKALKNISINDISRVRRIWEVYKSSGIKYSDFMNKKNKNFLENYNHKILLFTPDREKIYQNVNERFNKMIKEGAINEVKKLLDLNLDQNLPIMKAHGVPEISRYLQKKLTLEECILKSQQVTRNYVKRQLTWWRSSSLPIDQVFNEFPKDIDVNLIKI